MRRIIGFALAWVFFLCSTALAADDPTKFTGRWTLKAEQSEIHPGSQWITEEINILLFGHLLEFTEKQTFGEGGDAIRRVEKHVLVPNSNLPKGESHTSTHWNYGALVQRSAFILKSQLGHHKGREVLRLELSDPNTLVRTTTVREEFDKGNWIVVLYQREVFVRY